MIGGIRWADFRRIPRMWGALSLFVFTTGVSLNPASAKVGRSVQALAEMGKSEIGRASQADRDCQKVEAKECIALAIQAVGGSERLSAIKTLSYESIGHTLLVEQSYRQDPFISSYERMTTKIDFTGNRVRSDSTLTWPEADPGQAEQHSVLLSGPEGCVQKSPASASGAAAADTPCSLSDIDWVRDTLALGPLRLLPAAFDAGNLHYEPAEMLRSTSHTVIVFSQHGSTLRIMLNPFNHLPDAVETVEQFHDFWYQWGDVRRRIYFDNWQTTQGLRYPTNLIEERNGIVWKSTQLLNLKFGVPLDSALFDMDAKVAAVGAKSKGWDRPFNPKTETQLAPGITMFPGAWNATLVQQEDGVVILEAPISGTYTEGVVAEARKRYPNLPLKGVMSTSDSWPHVGGVRQAVASKLPVYILDLNQPLLNRLIAAKHQIHPDLLAQTPQTPKWSVVSAKTTVGSGPNRAELYPLRGACTERQYMVYFPQHHLLYASDTLALNDDGSLYDPELVREVVEAVQREGLEVTTVFAMHQGPVAWSNVVSLVQKSLS